MNVKRFRPGDEVFGDVARGGSGGSAEYVCAREDLSALKPANVTCEEAAATLGANGVIGALDALSALLSIPIAVPEVVLAGWLIVKAFSQSAIASLSSKVSEGPG